MKKSIKYIMILPLIIVLFAFYENVKAAQLTCNQIPVSSCPSPGVDAKGNACTKKYSGSSMVCTIKSDAKTCPEKLSATGTCPSVDDYGNKCSQQYSGSTLSCVIAKKATYEELKTCGDYGKSSCPSTDYKGNTCKKDSQGYCYIVKNNQSCSDIKTSGICSGREDCKWLTNSKGRKECFSVIKPVSGGQTCGKITDLLTCELRTDCTLLTNSKGKKQCYESIVPTANSEACEKITDATTCGRRTDCIWGTNSKGKKSCIKAKTTTGAAGSLKITKKKYSFKCSDVKYLTGIWTFLRVIAPFLLIIFGSLDFFKSMVAGDEKKMKESRGKFVKRLIAFILFIVLPFAVQLIFKYAGTYGSERLCIVKCIATNDTSSKGCE